MNQLYQILYTSIYETPTSRPIAVDVDDLVNYPSYYTYVVFSGSSNPQRISISDLQSEVGEYSIYATDENGASIQIGPERCFSEWPDLMIRSYLKRNPEQHRWFKTVVVDTIEERDRLRNDPDFEPESYVWVRNGQYGPEPEEYILTANRQFWVDIETYSLNKPSGVRAIETLYERLSSGYLFDTFGPSGQNKTECDFVFVTYVNTNLTFRNWTKTGANLRWDFGNGVTSEYLGVPTHTYVPGSEIATFSTTDSFDTVSYYRFSNNFRGAFPSVDFSNVTNTEYSFFGGFCGAIPDTYNVSNVTKAGLMFYFSKVTSIPNMNFDSLTTNSFDIFNGTYITSKIGKISVTTNYVTPPTTQNEKISIAGMFRYSSIEGFYDLETNGEVFFRASFL